MGKTNSNENLNKSIDGKRISAPPGTQQNSVTGKSIIPPNTNKGGGSIPKK